MKECDKNLLVRLKRPANVPSSVRCTSPKEFRETTSAKPENSTFTSHSSACRNCDNGMYSIESKSPRVERVVLIDGRSQGFPSLVEKLTLWAATWPRWLSIRPKDL